MGSLMFERFGEPLEVLRLTDGPHPEPGPGEVGVRLHLRPVNPSDLYQIRGRYGRLPSLPAVAGLEGLGTIVSLGHGVAGLALGQRVVFREVQGTWAEDICVAATEVVPVPDGVADTAAAQVMVNPLTAWAMFQEVAPPPGSWVVVTAAGSAVASCLLELARSRGVRVLALVRDGARGGALCARGADVVLSTTADDWLEEARRCVGTGAWGVFDAVGGSLATKVISLLRPGGLYLVYGALSLEPLRLPGGQMIYRQWQVRGFMISAWKAQVGEAALRAALAEVFAAQAQGLLHPPVGDVLPLLEWPEAVLRAETPGRAGKVLLRSEPLR